MKRLVPIFLVLVTLSMSGQEQTTRIDKSMTILTDVMRQLDMNYFDTLNYERMTEEGIRMMLRQVDPYTIYIPKERDTDLRIMTTGQYGGIGAMIMMRDSMVYIAEPYEGMPAQVNDVRAGDRLVKVDDFRCDGQTTKEVSNRLRGEAGTTVKLVLEREGEKKLLTREVVRKEIHLPAVTFYKRYDNVGYVLFSEFTSGSAAALYEAIRKMESEGALSGLIIDLRGNGGGLIDEAIRVVSLFVDKDTEVVTTKGKIQTSNRSYKTSSTPVYKDLPLVCLVNGGTASAAEIVSGSLQELGRATLIGERTFGKGLVQSIRPIAFGGNLKVTTAHYYLPSGRCIQAINYDALQRGEKLERDTAGGIQPDIVLTDSQKVDICYSLVRGHHFFDYANRYRQTHNGIAPPDKFEVSDEELERFMQFLDEKKFVYETETSRYLDDLLEVAEKEDIDSLSMQAMTLLRKTLRPSFRDAIMRHKDEVKMLLGADIVERYYFQRGRVEFMLRDDKALKKAGEILINR
ncbi:MAG: S41 family peptidase [Paludibacteraceae bacterium]|nr:S41 family peptidase [Paludibacteraceae bacterium]